MHNMRESFLTFAKKQFMTESTWVQSIFFELINHFDIKVLRSLPEFEAIAKTVVSQLSSEALLTRCKTSLIQEGRLATLDFLIQHCGYVLTTQAKIELLHGACICNSKSGIEFALKHGADPNVAAQGGRTALHTLVLYKRSSTLIELLHKQHNAQLDIPDQDGLTPLYMAASAKHKEAEKVLRKLKARTDLPTKWGQKNFQEWSLAVQAGRYATKPLVQPTILPPNSTIVEAYHAIFFSTYNQQSIARTKSTLLKHVQTSTPSHAGSLITLLLICHITTTTFDVKSIEKFVRQLITAHHFSPILATLQTLDYFVNFFRQSTQLDMPKMEWFLSALVALLNLEGSANVPVADQAEMYNRIVIQCNALGLFQLGEQLATQALALLPEATAQQLDATQCRAAIFHNLGLNQVWQVHNLEAIAHFKAAFELDPTNQDAFVLLVNFLRDTGHYAEAEALCQRQPKTSQPIAELHRDIIQNAAQELPPPVLIEKLNVLEETMPSLSARAQILAINLKALYLQQLGKPNAAHDAAEQTWQRAEQAYRNDPLNVDLALPIYNHLSRYLKLAQYSEALNFLATYKTKYPIKCGYPRIKCIEISLNIAVNNLLIAEELLNELTGHCNPNVLADLYVSLVHHMSITNTSDIEQTKKAMALLDQALSLNPDHEQAQYDKFLINILLKRYAEAQQLATELGNETLWTQLAQQENLLHPLNSTTQSTTTTVSTLTQEHTVSTSSSIEAALAIELAAYDPIKIHRYFQAQKKQLLLDAMSKLTTQTSTHRASWDIAGSLYQEDADNMVKIDSIFYKNYYCVLQPGLFKEAATTTRAQTAIAGGLCQRRFGTTGIIATDTCWYIKLDKDLCIVATEIYQNSKGQRLIIFNQLHNHPSKDMLLEQKKKMEIKLCAERASLPVNPIPQTASSAVTPVSNFFPPVNEASVAPTTAQQIQPQAQ